MATKVLISGASIAGPALAYWLDRYGFDVTIVERSGAVRGGGYPIDIRGMARTVAERMGIFEELRKSHVDTQRARFFTERGRQVAVIRPETLTGGVAGRDIEIPRGALATALVAALPPSVKFAFNDTISTLSDTGDKVSVTFASGGAHEYDLVLAADGLHSSTRALVFGPEGPFHHYIGFCFAGFSLPNDLGLAHEALMCNLPGKAMTLFAPGDSGTLHGFLTFARKDPPLGDYKDPLARRQLVADTFAGVGWHAPKLLDAMWAADDLFFDVVSQIKMPTWSQGRVALLGDAAHATSFMSGQGSSAALVGAYVLAGELATRPTHQEAFASYEALQRPFAEMNQAIVKDGQRMTAPRDRKQLFLRNLLLTLMPLLTRTGIAARAGREATVGIDLPDYEALLARA
jgi:2-polyprenyl-6-methoxyphenol hydroxylase-like FAD-dependent oxidoreductase